MKATMCSRVTAYLRLRRGFGYKLRIEGGMLQNFARYADRSGHRGPLTRELALRWAALPQNASQLYRARRLEVLRVFAQHQIALEPATHIPPRHVFGPAHCRRAPHIFTAAQIQQLLRRAGRLRGHLRPLTYSTLLGLLACTGLRISEALAMGVDDVDWNRGLLLIRESKYQHSRWVPLHSTALAQLRFFDRRRRKLFPSAQHFFVSDRGRRFAYGTVRTAFRELARGMKSTVARSLVRLHDMRHSFACRVLRRWQRTR